MKDSTYFQSHNEPSLKERIRQVKQYLPPSHFYQFEASGFSPRSASKWQVAGRCPFHQDRRPGSFKINVSTGAFRCFSCGAGGSDIIEFMRAKYGLSFPEALRELERRAGL